MPDGAPAPGLFVNLYLKIQLFNGFHNSGICAKIVSRSDIEIWHRPTFHERQRDRERTIPGDRHAL